MAYNTAVVGVTQSVIRLFERPSQTWLSLKDGLVVMENADTAGEAPALDPLPITGNLILFLALYWATPKTLRAPGVVYPLVAVAALFVSHVIHMVLSVEAVYAFQMGSGSLEHYSKWQREIIGSLRYFFDIVVRFGFPFVAWGAICVAPPAAAAGLKVRAGKKDRVTR